MEPAHLPWPIGRRRATPSLLHDPWAATGSAEPTFGGSAATRIGVVAASVLGSWAPVSVLVEQAGARQRTAAFVITVAALMIAVSVRRCRTSRSRVAAVLGLTVLGVVLSRPLVGATPMLVAAAATTVGSVALFGPTHSRAPVSGAATRAPLALLIVAASGVLWHNTTDLVPFGIAIGLAVVAIGARRSLGARPAAVTARVESAFSRLMAAAGAATVLIVATPLLWIPGAAVAMRQRLRRSTRASSPSWKPVFESALKDRAVSPTPVSAAGARRLRSLAIGVAAFTVVAVAAIAVVAVRAEAPESSALAAEPAQPPVEAAAPGGEDDASRTIRYSELPAGQGLDWADQVQIDKDSLLLPPGPVAGYGLGDSASRYTNVVDGIRVTRAPQPCECELTDVWVAGGSAAFGTGQRDDHTIPSELVDLAEADGLHVRVYNLAVPGYTLWQEYQRVLARLAAGHPPPRLVVFYDGFNDVVVSFAHAAHSGSLATPTINDAFNPFPVVSAAEINAALLPLGGARGMGAETGRRFVSLREIIRRHLEQLGIETAFFFQADALDTPLQREAVVNGESTLGPEQLDLFAAALESAESEVAVGQHNLRGIYESTPTPVFFDLIHTNEVGSRIAAEQIYQQIAPRLRPLVG